MRRARPPPLVGWGTPLRPWAQGGGVLGSSALAHLPDGLPFLSAGLRQRDAAVAVVHPLGVCLGLWLSGAPYFRLGAEPRFRMVLEVASFPVVIELVKTLFVASYRPAWPCDMDGLGGVLENPIHGACFPCCICPFCNDVAEWVVLVVSIEDFFNHVGEYPAVDVLFRKS